jgi:DMSO/TMAO reductase YedYZ molybdopterin-dependent catalytic subunit
MREKLYSRREWLALMAATPLALSLTACASDDGQGSDGSTNGANPGSQANGNDDATSGDAGRDNQLSEYQGTALDAVGKAKVQGIKGIQSIEPDSYRFALSGMVGKELSLSYDQMLELPSERRLVTLPCVEGWSAVHVWDGVHVSELLNQANYDTQASTLIFYSADGYSTALPLKTVLDEDMLLAWAVNGITLPKEYGYPFRAVAKHRLGYKWAKWLSGINVSDDEHFSGYWESRGYNNDASTPR